MTEFEGLGLKSVLGSGGFGIVWKVVENEIEEFALKLILSDKENLKVQNREFHISSRMEHKNLVKVFESYKTNISRRQLKAFIPEGNVNYTPIIHALRRKDVSYEIYYFKMELCGEILRNYLKEEHDVSSTRTNVTQLGIVDGIVEGLKYLHSKKIIHRDLKPENIMFSSKGFLLPVKIGDYGTCRVLKDPQISNLTSNVGTAMYLAPEAWSNSYSFQSDLYSLGLLIWEVLQLIPFKNLRSHFDRLVNDGEQVLVQLQPAFEHLKGPIIKLCKKKAPERPQSISEIGIETGTEIHKKPFSKLREITAKNSSELQQALETCEDDWTITLLEGEYQGPFEMRKNGLKLQGQGERTVLVPKNPMAGVIVLIVKGRNCSASNFKVFGEGCPSSSGVSVQGSHCSLENLWISSFSNEGVNIRSTATSTKINNVNFEKVRNAVQILGNESSLSKITASNCFCALKIEYASNTFVSDLCIIDPQRCGLQIQRCTDLKLNKVLIISKIKPKVENKQALHGISVLGCISGKIELQNVNCSGFECGLFIDKKSAPSKIKIQYDCNLGKIIGLDRPNSFKKLFRRFK